MSVDYFRLLVYFKVNSVDINSIRKRFADIYLYKHMSKFIDKEKARLYLWMAVGYFFIGLLNTVAKYPNTILADVFNNIWGGIYLIVVNFILFEYTVPFILRKRSTIILNILLAIPLLFVHMMLYSYASYAWRLLGTVLHIYTWLRPSATMEELLENGMAYNMASVFVFGITRHIYNYVKLKQSQQQLQIEKKEAELNYLRSQTNPHFLFNTLNNIYSLARDKSNLAPESILRLSKILRFMLYETSGAFIAVEQELKIITDYIELEKLRYDESLRINFSHNVEDMKQALPPLLLIPLVENAFKHGVSETRSNPFIDIHLSINNRQLKFVVKNSTEEIFEEKNVKENIGLSNLRRQLQLLYKDYDLSVQQGNSVFTSTLKINLASHV
jgi:two-component system, LytTR family, sensor kinase